MSPSPFRFRPPLRLAAGLAAALVGAGAVAEPAAEIRKGDYACTAQTRLAAIDYARRNAEALCNRLRDWDVARLAGEASIAGPGGNCEIYEADQRELGASVCLPAQDYGLIRGVLLLGGFRTQAELTRLSGPQWRDALIVALSNRTAASYQSLDVLKNDELAALGGLFVYLQQTPDFDPVKVASLGVADLRQAVRADLRRQTGMPAARLAAMSDADLLNLLVRG